MAGKQRDWLNKLRDSVTHQQVADRAGISRSYYTQIESGARNPSVKVAKRVAMALGFNWLIFFEN